MQASPFILENRRYGTPPIHKIKVR